MRKWLVGKLSSNFVSKIIRISTLSLIWCASNSNLFLRKLIFKCPIISLFRFLSLKYLNSAFILILSTWFLASGINSSFNKGVEATLFSSFCQLKMLDKTLVKVFYNKCVPVLFRFSLLPFKCCNFIVLEWSINKSFFRSKVQSNICLPHLLLPWNNNFVLWCLKWSNHACRFLNWTQHRPFIWQSDLRYLFEVSRNKNWWKFELESLHTWYYLQIK